MFCVPGMTSFRGLFEDVLGVPVFSSPSDSSALSCNKAQTRSVVSTFGVRVPNAQVVCQGDSVTMQPPFIVKPNTEDNSLGLTLVWEPEEIAEALRAGFEHDETLLVEDYIPGRELRVAVVERKGKLSVLPAIEYLVTKDNPIRTLINMYFNLMELLQNNLTSQ
ncbi:MAG: hypothetical protein MGG37_19575 [Trichodesmium sp. MAG_R01]|nr:hypothetical protein [Trichodesmium sp. MAG_R01]